MSEVAPAAARERQAALDARLRAAGLPADVASDIAMLPMIVDTPVIIEAARQAGVPPTAAARAFLEAGDRFRLEEIMQRARDLRTSDDYDRLAIAVASNAMTEAQRTIMLAALAAGGAPDAGLAVWAQSRQPQIERTVRDLSDIAGGVEVTVARLTVAASRLADLART